jgi:hypothetical protein
MAIGSGFFIEYFSHLTKSGNNRKAEYLYPFDPNEKYNSDYDAFYRAVLAYGEYFILINTIIPISLVVSLEFVKLI